MCQRVLIAMAFASRPQLVIADEPTTALDVTIQARIVRADRARCSDAHGTALMFITHDLRLAAQFCDEIMVLYAGAPSRYGAGARASLRAPPPLYALPAACRSLASARERALFSLPEQMPGLRGIGALEAAASRRAARMSIDECRAGAAALARRRAGPHVAACIRTELTPPIAVACTTDGRSAKATAPLLASSSG